MVKIGGMSSNARYFNSAALSDVTIHFSGRQVKAHRIVLASQSDHFRAMFEGTFKEANARDIHLHDDDPEALYGALAYCYGLEYDGQNSLKTIVEQSQDDSSQQSTKTRRLDYVIKLYATGKKYLMPKVQAHAEEYFNDYMGIAKPEYAKTIREIPSMHDKWLGGYYTLATLLYHTFGDSVKELRPGFVKMMWLLAPGFRGNEKFRQMMVDIPELAADMLDLAMDAREETSKM